MMLVMFMSYAHSHPTRRKSASTNKLSGSATAAADSQLLTDNILRTRRDTSPYVMFSSTKPLTAPWGEPIVDSNHIRSKRSAGLRQPQHACDLTQQWHVLTDALDLNNEPVKVVSSLDRNGTMMSQYIFERFCSADLAGETGDRKCYGIDETKFTSECTTGMMKVQAYYRKYNQTGWGYIQVRGSCDCIVEKRPSSSRQFSDFLDLLDLDT